MRSIQTLGGKHPEAWQRCIRGIAILLVAAGCSGTPAEDSYTVRDQALQVAEHYRLLLRQCRQQGGYLVSRDASWRRGIPGQLNLRQMKAARCQLRY